MLPVTCKKCITTNCITLDWLAGNVVFGYTATAVGILQMLTGGQWGDCGGRTQAHKQQHQQHGCTVYTGSTKTGFCSYYLVASITVLLRQYYSLPSHCCRSLRSSLSTAVDAGKLEPGSPPPEFRAVPPPPADWGRT
jgi:hypothetical protein